MAGSRAGKEQNMHGYRRSSHIAYVIPLLLALVGLLVTPSTLLAQDEQQVTWESYDVTVQVNEDGTLRVTESIVIRFNDSFSKGKRTIPMDRIESIDDVDVSVGTEAGNLTPGIPTRQTVLLEPGEFNAWESDGEFVIDYGFERTSIDASDRVRYVDLSYTVHGAIRDYPDAEPAEQQVRWTAIGSDTTETGEVESASATVVFPENIPEDRLAIDPNPTAVEVDRVVWEREGLNSGDALQVAVAFPPVTAATAPAWQADADLYEGRQEHLPAINLVLGLVSIVAWVVLVLAMVVRGVKDPEVGLVADIIPNRPDDLPAPLVGALVDEAVDAKEIIAGLLDLEREGFIGINDDPEPTEKDKYRLTLLRPVEEAEAWRLPMLSALFLKDPSVGKSVPMRSSIKDLRLAAMGKIARAYDDELYARGYFVERPSETRKRWALIITGMLLAVAAIIAISALWAQKVSGWIALPATISVIGAIVGYILVTKAAVKTTEGAVEAAKWRAFDRYIKDLKKGPAPERFLEAVQHDLPWAVALGFDSSWSKMTEDMDAPSTKRDARSRNRMSPVFIGDIGRGAASASSRSSESHSEGSASGGGGGLQGASTSMLAAVGGGSAGLFAMLNDAAAGFNEGSSSGSSSGGGFSGSSSVGSSGGGGHSFS
jgi:hypothetical protein